MKRFKLLSKIKFPLLGALFAVVLALAYFYPVLQSKVLPQSDIVQSQAMSRQVVDHRNQFNEEPYWIDNAFGGMPSYQVLADYPYDFLQSIDKILRFLPRPADYLFLYLLSFFLAMLLLRFQWPEALIGAIAYGFSTYLIIILGVGHNTKAQALGYLPLIIAAVVVCLRRRTWLSWWVFVLALGLQINVNHYQMTYYTLLMVLIIGLVYGWEAFRKQQLKFWFTSVTVLFIGLIFSLMLNATALLATAEYTAYSTRGKSELSKENDGAADGLDFDYITEYSYGISESLNLFLPRFMGGSRAEGLDENSALIKFLGTLEPETAQQILPYVSTYWGDQPIVAAPAYLGAVVLFLALIGLCLAQPIMRRWMLATLVLALTLSWGKNFEILSKWMVDYFPFYNKFRAVSSIQVLIEFCVPLAAVVGLGALMNQDVRLERKKRAFFISFTVWSGLAIILWLFGGVLFDFKSQNEIFEAYPEILNPLIEDRKSLLKADAIRALWLVMAAALVVGFLLWKNAKKPLVITALALLILVDLWGIDKNYVKADDFVKSRNLGQQIAMTQADRLIQNDNTHFRVFEPALGLSNARTAKFHRSLGGYHAAKPRRFQELYDQHIADRKPAVLNMLNVKYVIEPSPENPVGVYQNPGALGPAWFISSLKQLSSANEVLQGLGDFDPSEMAITQTLQSKSYQKDSTATIELIDYRINKLTYKISTKNPAFVVFSEMFYDKGWVSYLDGEIVPHSRVNYLLRGMEIEAGDHQIVFEFKPQVIQYGSWLVLGGYILLFTLFIFRLIKYFAKKNDSHP